MFEVSLTKSSNFSLTNGPTITAASLYMKETARICSNGTAQMIMVPMTIPIPAEFLRMLKLLSTVSAESVKYLPATGIMVEMVYFTALPATPSAVEPTIPCMVVIPTNTVIISPNPHVHNVLINLLIPARIFRFVMESMAKKAREIVKSGIKISFTRFATTSEIKKSVGLTIALVTGAPETVVIAIKAGKVAFRKSLIVLIMFTPSPMQSFSPMANRPTSAALQAKPAYLETELFMFSDTLFNNPQSMPRAMILAMMSRFLDICPKNIVKIVLKMAPISNGLFCVGTRSLSVFPVYLLNSPFSLPVELFVELFVEPPAMLLNELGVGVGVRVSVGTELFAAEVPAAIPFVAKVAGHQIKKVKMSRAIIEQSCFIFIIFTSSSLEQV